MKKVVLAALLALVPFMVFAQSASFIDTLLAAPAVTCGQAAYLVFVGASEYNDTVNPDEVFAEAVKRRWLSAKAAVDKPISNAEYAYLIMKAFGIKGGLMYGIFPGPRYAFRELLYKGIVTRGTNPAGKLSGTNALRIIRIAAEMKGLDK